MIFFPSFSADLSERDKQNAVRKICGRAAPKLARKELGTVKKKKKASWLIRKHEIEAGEEIAHQ